MKKILEWKLKIVWSDEPTEWVEADEIPDHIVNDIEDYLDAVEAKENEGEGEENE